MRMLPADHFVEFFKFRAFVSELLQGHAGDSTVQFAYIYPYLFAVVTGFRDTFDHWSDRQLVFLSIDKRTIVDDLINSEGTRVDPHVKFPIQTLSSVLDLRST